MFFQEDFFNTRYLRVLNLASEENLHSLNLGEFFPVCQEQLHIVVVLVLQEVLETMLHPKLLALVGEQADIYYRKHVLGSLYLERTPVDYDEILLCHWSKFKCNSFS